MAVTDDFTGSELDLNGLVNITSPTALVWGADGRLYVTQQAGEIFALTVAFGDKNPGDSNPTNSFYVTAAETILDVKAIPNHNDDGTNNSSSSRQVTGIDVTPQFDENGNPVLINGEPAVVMYVTSSDSRIGAGVNKGDIGLDTNSGVITKLVQTATGWDVIDIVRGLPRSEENHATNGLEVIQEIDPNTGQLLSERLIVASGGNANTGAPSNNFAGQQETPYSGALLEVDLDEINSLPVLSDNGRAYVYDLPTLDDPTRAGAEAGQDPFGGNDGLNSAKLLADGPVQIYSAGYRNPYDVEVTDDGRVFTYDNGANNNWGGRPAGEDQDGDTNSIEPETGTQPGFIATNLFVEDNNEIEDGNPGTTFNFDPQNWDQLHEATRSDDLNDRSLSEGQGGVTTYQWAHPDFAQPLTLVYGGHPNPTRAEGARAGLLYSPEGGVGNAKLMVSNVEKPGGSSDFLEVVSWLSTIGYSDAFINSTVVAVNPGTLYSETFAPGFGGAGATGRPTTTGVFSLVEDTNGPIGLPSDIDEIVNAINPVEGNYLEAGFTDGALDTGKGSINGLTEYTSSIFDDAGQATMQGAIIAASLNQGQYYIIGRDLDNGGVVNTTTTTSGNDGSAGSTPRSIAADRDFLDSGGAPLGLASIGDDLQPHGNDGAFRGTIWAAIYKQNGPVIEIFQPGSQDTNPLLGLNNYAGAAIVDLTDNDFDGVDHINDPFDFDEDNGINLEAGKEILLTFSQVDLASNPEFLGTVGDTGLLGAALDGVTPNRDEKSAADGFPVQDQESGLFDNGGNIIPGGNAPLFQIKEVQDGSAVGLPNTLRDALHTGVKLASDVDRVIAEIDIFNWYADQPGGGRVSGLMFGDGTQSNFVRVVFGDINGQPGVEVGLETGDSYQVIGTSFDAGFVTALTTGGNTANQKVVRLQLEISDIGGDYDIAARFRVNGETSFATVPLSTDQLPAGVLRAVLDGTHTISDRDTTLPSGAAFGIVAEKDDGVQFSTVDVDIIRIKGIGNEINASTEAQAEAPGGPDVDTVVYTGPAANIQLDPTVENFDGSGSSGDWSVTGTPEDNIISTGSGSNTVTTGAGDDVVIGSKSDLNGDEITDFSLTDKVIITDANISDANNVSFQQGSAVVIINGTTITFSGDEFANFDPSTGPNLFAFDQGVDGLEITLVPEETVIYRVNAGGATVAANDGGLAWESDIGIFNGTGPVSRSGFAGSTFSNVLTNSLDEMTYSPDVDPSATPWELFVEERSDNTNDTSNMNYNFDVEVGKTYKVTLFYTENWHNSFAAVPRVFDVAVEGAVPNEFNDIYPLRDATDLVDGTGAPVPTFADAPLTDPNSAANLEKQPYLGVIVKREFVYTATDGELNLTFLHSAAAGVQNPKINAIQVSELGSNAVVTDSTPPVVTDIVVEDSLSDNDSPRQVTVTLTDNIGFDLATLTSLTGAELNFTGITPASVSAPQVTLNGSQTVATLVYTISPPIDTSGWPAGNYSVSVAAGAFSDASGNDTAAASFDFTFSAPLQPGDVVLAVNAGGPAVDGAAYGLPGVTFEADTAAAPHPTVDFSQVTTGPATAAGNNTNSNGADDSFTGVNLPDVLFHSERWGNDFSYDVDLPDGTYLVDLYFAETFQGVGTNTGGVGSRLFDVSLEGTTVLDDYDLFDDGDGVLGNAAGAPLVKIVKTFEAVVTDGTLNIVFDSTAPDGADNGKISAFVVRVPEDGTPTDTVDGAAVDGGDFSDLGLTPTDIGTLAEGETEIVASQQGDDAPGGRERDYFTFTVAEGQVLTSIILQDWQTQEIGTPQAFIGIQAGSQVTVDPETFANVGDLLGGHVYNEGDVGTNLLSSSALGKGSEVGPGGIFTFGDGSGFDGPLPAGTYTLWLNQGGAVSTASLQLVTAVPAVEVTISVTGAQSEVENGDFGTTEVGFDLAASDLFSGVIEVTFDTATETGLTQMVSFADGIGRLKFFVDNDNVDNGAEQIELVSLVSGVDQAGLATVNVDNIGDGAISVVTEDDGPLVRGDVIVAINAGGPALTQDGIDFSAGQNPDDGNPFTGGQVYIDQGGGGANGLQPGFDNTVYDTEINDSGDDNFTFSYSGPEIDPTKLYFVDLYFAEIFTNVVGSLDPEAGRIFDVFLEGNQVLDNFDVLSENGVDINIPVVVQVAAPVSPGENGAIDLTFTGVVDRAKVSAIVIREAVGAPDISVSVNASEADENAGFADITFTRTGATDEPLTLTFAVTDGTAVAGTDYTPPTLNTVTFAIGETEATAQVPLIDNDVENPGSALDFNVSIIGASVPSGAGISAGTDTATITINDDEFVDPADIDGDGILNIDDPFAYDGSNDGDRALTAGNAFRQDFNVDTTDPFDANGGFSGILVNPGFAYPGNSETDPYGDRTSEAPGVEIVDGKLKITSTETDAFSGGIGLNNTLADGYQSAVDVSGVRTFEVVARANSPEIFTTIPTTSGFEQFGVTLGAGGVDDFVKLVVGDGSNAAPRVQISHNNSLVNAGTSNDSNFPINGTGPAVDISLVGDVEFRLGVDRDAGANGQVTGRVIFFAAADGAVLADFTTPAIDILAGSSLLAAMDGTNPLTGGTGGLAYGVFVSDWGGGNASTPADINQITVNYDFLEIRATEALSLSISAPAAPLAEAGDTGETVLEYGLSVPGFDGTMTIDYEVNGVPATATDVVFTGGIATLSIAIANDDVADSGTNVSVVLVGTSNAFVTVDPTPAVGTITEDDAAPVANPDAIVTREDTAITFNPAGNDSDADTPPSQLVVTSIDTTGVSADVTVSLVNGLVTVTPTNGFLGDVNFGYTVEDTGGNTATGAATVSVRELQTIRIQAEDFDSSDTYGTQGQAAADAGAVAFLPSGGTSGTATYNLDGLVAPGTYNVLVAYFDENDGVSTIGLDITSDGTAPFSTSFAMDAATPGGAAQAANLRTKVFANVEIGENGQLVLSGTTQGGEFARVDYFEFIQQEDIVDPTNFPAYTPTGIDDVIADENAAFSVDIGAQFFDDEEDPLTFTATGDQIGGSLPLGVVFENGILSGTPTQSGVFTISVVANDGNSNSAPVDFTLTVNDVPNAPIVIQPIPDQAFDQNQAVSIPLAPVFFDQDGDALTYTLESALPPGLAFVDGAITGAPTGAPGSFQVTVRATDPGGLSVTDSFVVNVIGTASQDPIRLEAEDATTLEGFFVASNGSRIQLANGTSGTATFDLTTVPPGSYLVRIGHWDENDGEATLSASLLGETGSQLLESFVLDDDATSSSIADPSSFRLKTLTTVAQIGVGDQLQLDGAAQGGEFVRIDYVELVPLSSANFAPTVTPAGADDVAVVGPVAIVGNIADAFADPEEDLLTFGIVDGPAWLGVDTAGNLTGTPDAAGSFVVTVSAEDAANNPGVLATTTFNLTVEFPDNQLPVLDFPVDDITVGQGGLVEQSVTFSDPDGQVVAYELSTDSPDWLSIDEFGSLSGTPGADDVGADIPVTVIATDNEGATASVQFFVTVVDENDAPQVGTPLETQSATIGQSFQYVLPVDAFTDADIPNGDELTYSATLANGDPLPSWLSIDPETGTLSGTPDSANDLSVVITATDLVGETAVAPAFVIDVSAFTVPTDPVQIEVESFSGLGDAVNFTVNNLAAASNDQILRLDANETGVVTHDLSAFAGNSYKVAVTYIDETDGAGAGRVFIDGQLIGTWNFDGTDGVQVNPGAATGTLAQPGNFRTVELDLPFGVSPTSVLTLEIDSEGGEFGRVDYITLIPAELPEENAAPTAVTVIPVAPELPEDADTAAAIKVADIVVTDDVLGTNDLTLAGADAASFTIVGTELFLNAGTALDFETKPSFDITVQVDDAEVGDGPFDAQTNFTLAIGDVNEAPTLTVTPLVTLISEEADTTASTPVATITVTDDALGTFNLDLSGDDAGLFEIVPDPVTQGFTLNLIAGATLDALTNAQLDVTVELDDPAIGQAVPEDVAPVSFTVVEGQVIDPTDGQALFTANISSTDVLSSSTFGENSMQITNQSANGVSITRVIIDLTDTIIPDTAFDTRTPAQGGPIGDPASKPYDQGTGSVGFTPAPGNGQIGGYDYTVTLAGQVVDPVQGGIGDNQLILDFDPGVFAVGDILSFSIDIDPFTATVGAIGGAVAGFEISGGTVTVEFDDGSAATSVIAPIDGTVAGRALVKAGQADLGAPILTLGDGTTDARVVSSADLPILIDAGVANANGTARVFILDTAFVSDQNSISINPPATAPNGIQGNNAQKTATTIDVQLDANGQFSGTIPLTRSTTQEANANGNLGFNYFAVGVVDGNNEVTKVSDALVVEFDPNSGGGGPTGDVLLRINSFGTEVVAAEGPNWLADTAANPSPFYVSTQNRGDVDPSPATPNLPDVPNSIFATARSDNGVFSYNIPVSSLPGISAGDTVTVNLYFAEAANVATLTRIFDVTMEGALAIDDLNPTAEFGAGSGGVISTVVTVVGDTLNIDFLNNNVQNAIVNGIEIIAGGENPINGGGVINPPADPADALEVLGIDDGTFDGVVQGQAVDNTNNGGNNGAVVLTILDGNDTVDASNFGANSIQLTNSGNKDVAAVFIDIRNAVFADQVFDNDGTGGDTASKVFQINTDDGTGAFFVGANGVGGNNDDNLFFAGDTPAADTSGLGSSNISGGYRGLLIRFDGSDGGFTSGETVGFSGDGDSNSLAGFTSGLLNPNNVTSSNFDTGGQSGSELIGSSFTVLFADGTTATGYLGSDTTQAGAAGEAVQGRATREAVLTVNTGTGSFDSGQTGTYGGTVPIITVAGTPGDTVRVTLHKGFQPTDAGAGGSPDTVAEVIQGRLDDLVPDFAVNNAFDVQTFDVVIGANGLAELPANAFDYVNVTSGEAFPGDDVQPLALTAAVVEPVTLGVAIQGNGPNDLVPVGPLSQPVYLTNPTQTPVDDSGVEPPVDGYFEVVGTGANQYFKIQIEDGSGGTDPGGKWQYVTSADANGNQSGFQGDGYYLFGSTSSTAIDNQVGTDEVLEYNILVDENSLGNYTFSFRVSRDGVAANDQQNDLWLNFKHADEPGNGDIVDFLVGNGSNVAEPDIGGFVKIFGGPNTGAWGTTGSVDGLPNNFTAQIAIAEAGLYTIQVDGRSQGFHVDSFELYKGNNPSTNVPDSPFVEGSPGGGGGGGGGTGGGGGGTPTGDPIRLQAEDATSLSGNYTVQNIGTADGGQVIGVTGGSGSAGGATFNLGAAGIGAGTYNVRVVYYDENDGVSTLNIDVGDTSQTITLNENTPSGNAGPETVREVTLTDVLIEGGDILTLSAIKNLGEPVRVDYFEFTPTDGSGGGGTGGGGGGTGGGGGGTSGQVVVAVDASSDDFEQFGGATSSDLEFGANGSQAQYVGIRFDGIDIPNGVTITDAFLRFEAFENSSGSANYTIEIENSLNAATYSSGNNPNSRTYADEFVWSNVESWTDGQTYRTPDISDLIESVIGAGGATDAALGFRIEGSGNRAAMSFDGPGAAPELVIIYEEDSIL